MLGIFIGIWYILFRTPNLLLLVKLNGGRVITGVLRGFDPYMNIVMDDTVEERSNSLKINIGMVVRLFSLVDP